MIIKCRVIKSEHWVNHHLQPEEGVIILAQIWGFPLTGGDQSQPCLWTRSVRHLQSCSRLLTFDLNLRSACGRRLSSRSPAALVHLFHIQSRFCFLWPKSIWSINQWSTKTSPVSKITTLHLSADRNHYNISLY